MRNLQPALIAVTLFVLATGVATLAFWFYAAQSGILNLNETTLFFVRGVGLIGLMIGALGLFIAVGTFRRSALPAAELQEAIDRAADGEYNIQVQETGPREMRALARALNEMFAQLQKRDESFHKLQLAVAREMQSRLDAIGFQVNGGEPNPQLFGRLAEIVRDWTSLAALETGGVPIEKTPTDVGAIVQETLSALHLEASERGVSLHAAFPEPSPVCDIDPIRFREILGCTVISALSRSSAGGEIKVDLHASQKSRRLSVSVNDNGKIIPEPDLPHVFTKFEQSPPTGSGLELPLAKMLVEAQGGEITATSRTDSGTTLDFILPLD